jgi:CheY-like chemotaxis protein
MTQKHKLIGEILVESQILSAKTVERVLARAARSKMKLGMALEEIELITPEELATALGMQFGIKMISNLSRFQIPATVLAHLTSDVAMQHLILPLKVENGWLAVAVADPTNTRMLEILAANTGLKIASHIASRPDITAAISKNYLGSSQTITTQRTLLVVEDDKLVQTKLNTLLTGKGYRVVIAADGIEAFKMLITEKPQVVLTDKEMPKLNGYGLLAAMRNVPEMNRIPVILLTGSMTDAEESGAFDKGFFDYILKPVADNSLLTRVKRAMHFYENQKFSC